MMFTMLKNKKKIVAWSGLEPALSSTLDHRSDALPSALNITPIRCTGFNLAKCSQWINVTLGCTLRVSYYYFLLKQKT